MKSNNDISPFIAMALLLLVLLGLLGLHNYEFVIGNWDKIKSAIYRSQDALLLFIISMLLNIYIISMVIERSLGYKKQGSKLRSIKNEKINYKNLALKSLLSVFGVSNLLRADINIFYRKYTSTKTNTKWNLSRFC